MLNERNLLLIQLINLIEIEDSSNKGSVEEQPIKYRYGRPDTSNL